LYNNAIYFWFCQALEKVFSWHWVLILLSLKICHPIIWLDATNFFEGPAASVFRLLLLPWSWSNKFSKMLTPPPSTKLWRHIPQDNNLNTQLFSYSRHHYFHHLFYWDPLWILWSIILPFFQRPSKTSVHLVNIIKIFFVILSGLFPWTCSVCFFLYCSLN
jgi:hypothetical protein